MHRRRMCTGSATTRPAAGRGPNGSGGRKVYPLKGERYRQTDRQRSRARETQRGGGESFTHTHILSRTHTLSPSQTSSMPWQRPSTSAACTRNSVQYCAKLSSVAASTCRSVTTCHRLMAADTHTQTPCHVREQLFEKAQAPTPAPATRTSTSLALTYRQTSPPDPASYDN